jgi:hypothetical protein
MTEADQVDDEVEDQVEFKFDELSDEAKRVAVEWYRVVVNSDWEPEYEDVVTCMGFLGIEFGQESYETCGGRSFTRPNIECQISWCQGDGAVFAGKWKAEDMDIAALHEYAPQDEKLHAFGSSLTLMLLRYPQAAAYITTVRCGSGLSRMEVTANVDETDDDSDNEGLAEMEPELLGIFKDCAQWIYTQQRDELEWQGSEEVCIEGIEANDYTFDEEGNHI